MTAKGEAVPGTAAPVLGPGRLVPGPTPVPGAWPRSLGVAVIWGCTVPVRVPGPTGVPGSTAPTPQAAEAMPMPQTAASAHKLHMNRIESEYASETSKARTAMLVTIRGLVHQHEPTTDASTLII